MPYSPEPQNRADWSDPALAKPIAALRDNPDPVVIAQAINQALAAWPERPPQQGQRVTVQAGGHAYTVTIDPETGYGTREIRVYLNWRAQDQYEYCLTDAILAQAESPGSGPGRQIQPADLALKPEAAGKSWQPARPRSPDREVLAAAVNAGLTARIALEINPGESSETVWEDDQGRPKYKVSFRPKGRQELLIQVYPCWTEADGYVCADPARILAEAVRPAGEKKKVEPAELKIRG